MMNENIDNKINNNIKNEKKENIEVKMVEEVNKEIAGSKNIKCKNIIKRHTISICEDTYKKYISIVERCNNKQHGKSINAAEVIRYAANLIKDCDILKIQEQSLTLKDKISQEHQRYISKTKKQLSLDEFLAMKLKIF